jgi:hypothetical protein
LPFQIVKQALIDRNDLNEQFVANLLAIIPPSVAWYGLHRMPDFEIDAGPNSEQNRI